MNESFDPKKLIDKYLDGKATEEEKALLENWYARFPLKDRKDLSLKEHEHDLAAIRLALGLPAKGRVRGMWFKIGIAATVAGLVVAGALLYNLYKPLSVEQQEVIAGIKPGQTSATLTLASGQRIVLSKVGLGELAKQTGVVIQKSSSGQLIYKVLPQEKVDSTKMNTLSTTKGETFQVTLPDGSKVWLNSESSLTYPVSFAVSRQRLVRLSGEAYFEVAKDAVHPFLISSDGQTIRVVGTHFNVRDYSDEKDILTTLLEGIVEVRQNGVKETILPGQQASNRNGAIVLNKNVDTENAVAWKNGYFKFDTNLEDAMDKIARWYDIEVVYKVPREIHIGIGGKISRNRQLSEVLGLLEQTGSVHFSIEGRKVIVNK